MPNLIMLLRGRTLLGRGFMVAGPDAQVIVEAGESFAHRQEDVTAHVTLPLSAARSLADTIQPRQGDYPVPGLPSLLITVVPSRIKDQSGNVVQIIGA